MGQTYNHYRDDNDGYLFCSVYSYQTAICWNHLFFGADSQRLFDDKENEEKLKNVRLIIKKRRKGSYVFSGTDQQIYQKFRMSIK